MSIQLVNKVLDLPLRPVAKLILAVLADNCDDTGFCWPSIKRIAERASVSKRTAQRVIGWLCDENWVTVAPRYRTDGSRSSNGFQLFPGESATGAKLTPGGAIDSASPAARAPSQGGAGVTPRTDKEPPFFEPPPAQSSCVDHSSGGSNLDIPPCFPPSARGRILAAVRGLDQHVAQQVLDEVSENYKLDRTRTVPLRFLRFLVAAAKRGEFTPELCFTVQEHRDAIRRKQSEPAPEPERPALSKIELAQRMAALRATLGRSGPTIVRRATGGGHARD